MTIPARTIAQLARLSLTDEQAEAVAVMLRDVEDATRADAERLLEGRRASDRKRKQEERERTRLAQDELGHVTSRDVTGRPVTSADIPDTSGGRLGTGFSSESKSPPSPPKGGTSPAKKPKKPIGTLCPEDLKPSESHYLKCEQRGAPRSIADRAVAVMANWSNTNAHREIAYKSDWPKALHRFVDDEIEKFQRGDCSTRAAPNGQGPPYGPRLTGASQSALDKAHRPQGARHAPTFNLESKPFPSRHREPASDRGGGGDPDDPVEESPSGGGVAAVFDFSRRRAV